MVLHGRFENGVVVLSDGILLPNGSEVTVIVSTSSPAEVKKSARVKLPLVPSESPGSLKLSADDVAEFLNRDGISS